MNFQDLELMDEQLELMNELSERFFSRAHQVDIEGSFPYDNIQDLKDTGYTSLTVPKKYRGKEISLFDMLRFQEKIAEGDGATALSIGWHMGIIKNLSEKRSWNENIFKKVCEDVKKGSLINGAATEPRTGSPTRGGRPETIASKDGDNWIINGRKTFTTMAPVLDYFIVSASINDSDQVGNFLIPRTTKGILIEETWDSIALRGTGSHDLVLQNVSVPGEYYVEQLVREGKKANGWLLHIPACYLGIAKAAKKYAIEFALNYSPNSVEGTIVDLPNVRHKIGEMELKLMESEYFLHSVAKQWDDADEQGRGEMGPILGAVKHTVTNNAITVVDLAMRLVGARSLSLKNPLQRYYRDVRAGLHNPPMDDMTIQVLANHAVSNFQK
ncbi:acyl-CoA dehydrogenase family protein [Bacillus sp. OK048]|uniref:acyl-CoA dehydrogenase family protein n=1 Tax=Bacillus sp. OK048 TaxID=1882761 RepID=UPI00088C59AD|nr:acyl-CoA dehydrogenase family protein [Bacillus sp. OK048]SDL88457.1 Acyl-CoA dehydrogenase [Bacillus sp. OK048]